MLLAALGGSSDLIENRAEGRKLRGVGAEVRAATAGGLQLNGVWSHTEPTHDTAFVLPRRQLHRRTNTKAHGTCDADDTNMRAQKRFANRTHHSSGFLGSLEVGGMKVYHQ